MWMMALGIFALLFLGFFLYFKTRDVPEEIRAKQLKMEIERISDEIEGLEDDLETLWNHMEEIKLQYKELRDMDK